MDCNLHEALRFSTPSDHLPRNVDASVIADGPIHVEIDLFTGSCITAGKMGWSTPT